MKQHALLALLCTSTAALAADLGLLPGCLPLPEDELHLVPQQDDDEGGSEHGDARADDQRRRVRAGIVPGKSAESLIVQASLHQQDMEMPPGTTSPAR
jgi:hypothetical protein